ncbi:hypothetical protein HY546_03345 [archaeon]|nr:hypothetical protein [archaeon]
MDQRRGRKVRNRMAGRLLNVRRTTWIVPKTEMRTWWVDGRKRVLHLSKGELDLLRRKELPKSRVMRETLLAYFSLPPGQRTTKRMNKMLGVEIPALQKRLRRLIETYGFQFPVNTINLNPLVIIHGNPPKGEARSQELALSDKELQALKDTQNALTRRRFTTRGRPEGYSNKEWDIVLKHLRRVSKRSILQPDNLMLPATVGGKTRLLKPHLAEVVTVFEKLKSKGNLSHKAIVAELEKRGTIIDVNLRFVENALAKLNSLFPGEFVTRHKRLIPKAYLRQKHVDKILNGVLDGSLRAWWRKKSTAKDRKLVWQHVKSLPRADGLAKKLKRIRLASRPRPAAVKIKEPIIVPAR